MSELADRVDGIMTMLQCLTDGQQRIISRLDLLSSVAGVPPGSPAERRSNSPSFQDSPPQINAPTISAVPVPIASGIFGSRMGSIVKPLPNRVHRRPPSVRVEINANNLATNTTGDEIPATASKMMAPSPIHREIRRVALIEKSSFFVPELHSLPVEAIATAQSKIVSPPIVEPQLPNQPLDSQEQLSHPAKLPHNTSASGLKKTVSFKKVMAATAAMKKPTAKVFYTDEPWRECLHGLLVVLTCLEFISITCSFVYCGSAKSLGGFLSFLFTTTSLLLLAEMGLNFFTARPYHKWEIVDDVKSCRKAYLKGWFAWDLFMAFPIDLLALAAAGGSLPGALCLRSRASGFNVLCLIRLLHLVRIPQYFRRRNHLMDTPRWVNALFFLAISTLIVHLFAVIWMLWASEEEQGVDDTDEGHGYTFAYQYISAFNWAFQSFVHGKADAHPHYTATVAFSLVVKIFGFLVVTTMEAKLAEFFVNHDPFHVWARQRRQQLASLISANDVTWEIQKSIMAIYPTLLNASMRQFYNVMQDLPPFLSAKVNECMKIKLISKVPMFSNVERDCQAALANALVQEVIPPETDIVRKGDVATSMYFLDHGVVDVIVENAEGCEVVLTSLKEGSWFGEIALLQDTNRTATVRTTTVVTVYQLDKSDFNQIATEYPVLRDILEAIAAQRMSSFSPRKRSNSRANSKSNGFTSIESVQQPEAVRPSMETGSRNQSAHLSQNSNVQPRDSIENPLTAPLSSRSALALPSDPMLPEGSPKVLSPSASPLMHDFMAIAMGSSGEGGAGGEGAGGGGGNFALMKK